ncbi:MAG: hypothetical protein GF364_21545 [Candidatus Lokiarchaeota archaeon]|nr:hypothetical protein [Candidatus Lokiarchaeota archaeon]
MAGTKKDVVKAVEEHGKILAIEGKYEKPKKVIKHCYASVKEVIKPRKVPKEDLSKYDMVLVGCPGSEIPKSAISKFRDYVLMDGGWLYTTDWCLRTIVENAFPGYIRWAGQKTADAVVACQIVDPHHPFLDGLAFELKKGKYASKGPKKNKSGFSWWLEDKSFPITVDRPDLVVVLIRSREIGKKWGEDPVLCYFDVGKKGGRVIHQISHTHLQKGGKSGKFASAMILTNILDEKVGIKHGIKKKSSGAPNYQEYYGTSQQPTSGVAWAGQQSGGYNAPNQGDYVTPSQNGNADSGLTPELVGTAKVVEVTDVKSIPSSQKCALGDGNFVDYQGRVFKCGGCGAFYHENCLNIQLQTGMCKICERIFLY